MRPNTDQIIDLSDLIVEHQISNGQLPRKSAFGHDSPPEGYPKNKSQYADPANFKYPIDNAERVRAAWSYINKDKNASEYSSSDLGKVKSRIKKAGRKYGITFTE